MALNLTNLLASQMTGYFTYDNNFNVEDLKKVNYVTAANGTFRVEKTPTALFKTKISDHKKPIPGLRTMTEGPELLIPKIPFKFLQQALSFYIDVYDKDKTEASLLFFWNKDNVTLPKIYSDKKPIKGLLVEGQLVVYVPQQKNSSGLSEFHMDPMVDWCRENLALLAETHSHHVMNAFFSGTDDANENSSQFYGVWGKIKDNQPQFAFRYCSGDVKQPICPSVLFEWPMITSTTVTTHSCDVEGFEETTTTKTEQKVYPGPFPKIDYPAEWMEQHTAARVATTGGKGYGKRYGASYGGNYGTRWGGKQPKGNRSLGGSKQADLWDDFDAWEAEMYHSTYAGNNTDEWIKRDNDLLYPGLDGMEGATVKKTLDPAESNPTTLSLIEADVVNITADLVSSGLNQVVEEAIESSRKELKK